jgi:hypothetical protein
VSTADTVRLLVGMLHPVPDARAILLCHNGQRVEVGYHPSAELSPCQLRSVVIGSRCPGRPDYTALVAHIDVHGSLESIGGGLYRRVDPANGEQRWFSTFVPPAVVKELLDRVEMNLPDNAFEATIHPDCAIGTTAVCITASLIQCANHLDEVAFAVLASCVAEELISHAHQIGA